ncbi:thiamine pyrophosphokinase [Bifidobacterium pseudolongum subsp. globosum]|uniref:Thiamine diphosphokinase n=1 Tax=Bifidobacterium pseudolongum subsp. globosum TaxID=1690 RepID=A0A4Q5AG02_9BIFI|nr:thiamine diphosphokinase [Bifidobacterium pseudolongum]RYP99939.1 thiamine pyrophosphokinase [Bifidobacterium pseudolongum subsp. globosum]RYQ26697.1 thiamine pyrophosphokinase [Bifidobacterium pseudolongum subsp. globosum]RYQ28689.1 thiamine pyrophosphokinase [Bifidobacterium pseudolongum subsp. globosum]
MAPVRTARTPLPTCVVFAAGEYYHEPIDVPPGTFVVAADGGYDHARELGVQVDAVVGDFDSVHSARGAIGAETVALPPQKDDPDLLSALKIGWAHGGRAFHIYGGLGGRVDHTISNIQQLAFIAAHGGIAFLHGAGQIVTAVCDAALVFPAHPVHGTQYISVFAHSDEARGVDERGLAYELHDATMTNLQVNGLSNEFVNGLGAEVRVRRGLLTVVFDAAAPLPTLVGAPAAAETLGAPSAHVSAALADRG